MKSGNQKRTVEKSGEDARMSPDRGQQHGKAAGATRQTSSYLQQLSEDRVGKTDPNEPGSDPVGAMSSANSISADPFAREKSLAEPVPQVTRHI